MKQILHANGFVLQWQDTEKFNYAASLAGVEILPVTDEQWANQDTLKWVRDGVLTDVAPSPMQSEEAPPKTIFATREYLKKFTMAEYAAARTHTNIGVQWALDNLIGAQFVDINDSDTIAGLDLMVAEGVITPERRTELLTPEAVE